jgi:pimeloyl-ACP methyl ester carboxylesterase
MPYLKDLEYVAIDIIGHGESAHRDVNSLNHYINYVRDIKLILDALGWDQCHLLGHSMGGGIGLLAASVLSERIQSIAMIDIFHPSTREEKDNPEMLKAALSQFANWDKNQQKIFPSLETAVKARLGASPFVQTEENARLIMQYATEQLASGYRLRSDARLAFRSPIMLSQKQIHAFIRSVHQPVLAIVATRGMLQQQQNFDDTVALFNNIETQFIKGGHHVHMENPAETSLAYLKFVEQL